MSARAALDAARAVFAPSLGRAPVEATTAPEWIEVPDGLATPRARSAAMWDAAERVLRDVVGRDDLAGQALVGEARRLQRLTLGEAHALVALHGWLDRQLDPASTEAEVESRPQEAEQRVAREAWQALERAATAPSITQDVTKPVAQEVWQGATQPIAQEAWQGATRTVTTAMPGVAPPATAPPAAAKPPADAWEEAVTATRRPWYTSSGALLGGLLVVLLAAAGGWYLLADRRDRDYRDGVAAYERGAREVARQAFVRAARAHPDDARPLVYLGRMAREEKDLAPARRFLENAVRVDPASSMALRELGSALLADGQPEIARRFYVRALELSPTDRLAQGFLGCALFQLGRVDEARRWVDRAGPGEWTPCVSGPPPALPPPVRAPLPTPP